VAERAGREVGCWITAREALGELPHATPLHWHLDAYPSRAAAEAAKGPRGTVVESLGRVWLFTVAEVGPLPTREGVRYVAQYMEGVSPPSARSIVHRHPGPEAWHNVAGRMCVESPEAPPGSATQGWALRVQKCAVGRSQEVSSSVPARTATKPPGAAVPGFAPLQTQAPHSAQTHRVTVRPLSAVRWKDRGSTPAKKRHASAATTTADENALPVSRWQAVQWHV
jgi:hypothetical protein